MLTETWHEAELTASHPLNAQTNNGVYLLSTMQICNAGDSRGLKYSVFCSKLKLFQGFRFVKQFSENAM